MDVFGDIGGIIEVIQILATIMMIPFNYNLSKIMILKDFIPQGDHVHMSKTYMTFMWMVNDIGEVL
jgi:hypothetical protein